MEKANKKELDKKGIDQTNTEDINKLHNQEDVNPTTQLDQLVEEEQSENLPDTNGTGSNRAVYNAGTVIIKEGEDNTEK